MAEKGKGRPLQGEEAKRVPLSFRTTPSLRDALDRAATQSGKSLAQEVEHRLDRSFRDDHAAGGSEQARLLETFRLIWDAVTRNFGTSWLDEPNAWDIATKTVVRMLLQLEPPATADLAPIMAQLSLEDEKIISTYRERHDAWRSEKKEIDRTLLHNALKVHGGTALDDRDRQAGERARARRDELGPEPVPDLPPDLLNEWQAGEVWRDTLARAENAAWQVALATLAELKKL